MASSELLDCIRQRAAAAGVSVPPSLAHALAAYYTELDRWNRSINLTALPLDASGTEESVDKLLIEPVAAAACLPQGPCALLDVGSGGGSPAIPLKLVRPDIGLWMVEARQKKAVFLKHVSRQLGLSDVVVEQAWLDDLSRRPGLRHRFAAATVRAVRFDTGLARALTILLAPGGLILYFSAGDAAPAAPEPERCLSHVRDVPLIAGTNSRLIVLRSASST